MISTLDRDKRKVRILCMTLLMYLLLQVSQFFNPIRAAFIDAKDLYLAGTWEDESYSGEISLPDWSVFVDAVGVSSVDASSFQSDQYSRYSMAVNIYNSFKTESKYNKAVERLRSYGIVYNGDENRLKPRGDNPSQKQWDDLARAVNHFNKTISSETVNTNLSSIFDVDKWDPNANAGQPILDIFYSITNFLFTIISHGIMCGFLVQTGADIAYIMFPLIRPLIGYAGKNSGQGGQRSNNANTTFGKTVTFAGKLLHICSEEAAEACGELSGGTGGGQNADGDNKWFKYGKKRFPVIACCLTYLVLVGLSWWPRIIANLTGIVVTFLEWLFPAV